MEASDMLDVIHFFLEEDTHHSSKEEADVRNSTREIIYQDFYGHSYKYSDSRSSQSASAQGGYYIEEPEDDAVVPFDPLKGPTKSFVPATPVNAAMSRPFGAAIEEPLSK
jgi:hypothetical protein